MSNFLNNLVARTLNLAPVVQPRITSRFEPSTAPPDQSVEVQAPPAAEPPVTTTKVIESRITEPAPIVVVPPQIERERVINTIRNTHVESKHEVVQVPVVEKIHERVHTESRINTEKSTDSRLEIREDRIIEPAPAPKAPDPLHPRLNVVEPAAPVTVIKEVPVTTPIFPRIEPAPPMPAPRFEMLPVPQQVEPTETINVTIGRVDVRAVFSAQAPKAPVRASSTNSLDDYLKQRSEGRR
jgi:hypothetical protein